MGAERGRDRERRGDGRRECGPERAEPRVLLAVPPRHDVVQRVHGDAAHQLGRLGGRRAHAPLQPRRRVRLGAGTTGTLGSISTCEHLSLSGCLLSGLDIENQANGTLTRPRAGFASLVRYLPFSPLWTLHSGGGAT